MSLPLRKEVQVSENALSRKEFPFPPLPPQYFLTGYHYLHYLLRNEILENMILSELAKNKIVDCIM